MVDKVVIEDRPNRVNRPLGKMLINNFLGGIAWGLGVIIGTTIILALIAFFVSKVDFVPILGKFLSDVIKATQIAPTNLSR